MDQPSPVHHPLSDWAPDSWKAKPALQQPVYPDPAALTSVLRQVSRLPPLVNSWEIEKLRTQLAEAARGERFLLQGGACAETFADCAPDTIVSSLKVLLQMSLVLMEGGRKQVIRVGRFAGQYAKPRSADFETHDGVTLPSFRGDMINRPEFTSEARQADPELLLRAYERSALTLNFIRALVDGGFADLHHPEYWDLGFVSKSPRAAEYRRMVTSISNSLRFMEVISGRSASESSRMDFFTSHEGLHLHYEEAQTRQVPRRHGWYDLTTHYPWIGERTRAIDGAHVEFFRGIINPIGVKLGPRITADEALELTEVLNPGNQPGRLTFILRLGVDRVSDVLPPLVQAIRRKSKHVLWVSDPMHGNGQTTSSGVKTRYFDKILGELEQTFLCLKEAGVHLGGVHVELTGENVTECIGGASGVTEADLTRDYRSQLDPRLNYEQSMEMALLLARLMAKNGWHK